jgi:peptide/nickel transport system substrate-binding protein
MEQISDTSWQITLRENVFFHDGAPMDAEAVKASLERAVEQIATAQTLLNIAGIEVNDPQTLTVVTAAPSPILPNLLTEPSTVIVNAAAAQAQGDAFSDKPIMTGPFAIESFQIDREVIGTRFEQYYGEKPKVERVVINVQADANARFLALQSGQVDVAVDIRPENALQIANDQQLRAVPASPVATMFLYVNHARAPWNDAKVRQALAHAIPSRETFVRSVLRDQGVPGKGNFPPAVLDCPDLQPYPNDPAQAKTLLAEAGFADSDGDGILEKDGKPLTMLMMSYPQRPALNPMAEIIQSSFKEIGIQVDIQTVEQINEALEPGEWDGAMYFNNLAATGDPFGSLSQFFVTDGSSNRGKYSNPEVDKQIEQLRPLSDRAERRALACQISQQIIQDVAIIPLVYPNFTYGVSNQVTGLDTAHPYFLYFVNSALGKG